MDGDKTRRRGPARKSPQFVQFIENVEVLGSPLQAGSLMRPWLQRPTIYRRIAEQPASIFGLQLVSALIQFPTNVHPFLCDESQIADNPLNFWLKRLINQDGTSFKSYSADNTHKIPRLVRQCIVSGKNRRIMVFVKFWARRIVKCNAALTNNKRRQRHQKRTRIKHMADFGPLCCSFQ